MRLKKMNVKIKMIIDWWENQPLDKGLHLGINKFYENTSVLAYQGFPTNLAVQYYPKKYEQAYKVVPDTISVTGKRQFTPESFQYLMVNKSLFYIEYVDKQYSISTRITKLT